MLPMLRYPIFVVVAAFGWSSLAGAFNNKFVEIGSMVGLGHISLAVGKKRSGESENAVWKRMKKEFIEEMRYVHTNDFFSP